MSDFDFLKNLSESRLFPSRKSLKDYDLTEISELAYLHILALNILLQEEVTEDYAKSYCRKTARGGNFNHWRADGTDLYVMLHAIADKHEIDNNDEDDDSLTLPVMVYNWIKSGGTGPQKESETKRLFTRLDTLFKIKNSSMRAMRRLIMDWQDLTNREARLAMTRLLQFFRTRARRGDFLPHLTTLAAQEKLEIHDVCNPESGENCKPDEKKHTGQFLKTLALAAGVGVAASIATRRLRESRPNKAFENSRVITYNVDKIVYHTTTEHAASSIMKNGFETGRILGVGEKRSAIFFSGKDVNPGLYARNDREGEANFGQKTGLVEANIKGLRLLNLTYREDDEFINHKYSTAATTGNLDQIPEYASNEVDGVISFLSDGSIYQVVVSRETANRILFGEKLRESRIDESYRYLKCCVDFHDGNVDDLNDMIEKGREISYGTFMKAVGVDVVARTFPDYDWSRRPRNLTLKGDYHVRYYKSRYRETPCYYIVHSAIEYIFVPDNFSNFREW